MLSRLQWAVLLMIVGSLVVVGPILHGPVTETSYEYEVEEVNIEDELPTVGQQSPDIKECSTSLSDRECTLERMVAVEEPVTHLDEFDNRSTEGVREHDTVYVLEDKFLRPVTIHDGNGTVTFTHETVSEEEFIEAGVVDARHVRHSDAAIESIESGHVTTDESIEMWEHWRIVEYEDSYYKLTNRSYHDTEEPDYVTIIRFLIVLLGFWLLLYGRKVQVLNTINR